MHKRKIKYQHPFTGEEVEKEFYFHLSKAELLKMQFSPTETLSDVLENIIHSENKGALLEQFDKFIMAAYGQKSADGEEFEKSDEMRKAFANTAAYQTLFMELVENAEEGAKFINAIMPEGFVKAQTQQDQDKPAPSARPTPAIAAPDAKPTEAAVPTDTPPQNS